MAQLVAPAVSFVGMIRQVQRVERPVAPQSQPSAEDTPTGEAGRNRADPAAQAPSAAYRGKKNPRRAAGT
jgi:hypothetical protein